MKIKMIYCGSETKKKAELIMRAIQNLPYKFEENGKLFAKIYEKVLNTKNDYLCYLFAKQYCVILEKWEVRALGRVVAEGEDLKLNIDFAKEVDGADVDLHEKIILDSKNNVFIETFMREVEDADYQMYFDHLYIYGSLKDNFNALIYYAAEDVDFSKNLHLIAEKGSIDFNLIVCAFYSSYMTKENQQAVLKRGSVFQNIDIINCEPSSLLDHAKMVAKQGSLQDSFKFVEEAVNVYGPYLDENQIEPCTSKILASKNLELIYKTANILQPYNLEEYANAIRESKDLFYNFLACENWPDPTERKSFEKIVASYPIPQFKGMCIFMLKLDQNTVNNYVREYYHPEEDDGDELSF